MSIRQEKRIFLQGPSVSKTRQPWRFPLPANDNHKTWWQKPASRRDWPLVLMSFVAATGVGALIALLLKLYLI